MAVDVGWIVDSQNKFNRLYAAIKCNFTSIKSDAYR